MEIDKSFLNDLDTYIGARESITLSNGYQLFKDEDFYEAQRELRFGKTIFSESDEQYIHLERLYRNITYCNNKSHDGISWSIFYINPFTKKESILPGAKYQLTFDSKGGARKSLAQYLTPSVANQLIGSGCIQIKQSKILEN